MSKTVRHDGSFQALDEKRLPNWIDVSVHIVEAGDSESEALAQFQTREGRIVNRLDKGKYLAVDSGETLTSTDPKAF